ncbi:MAG TPA: deoxyribose-phosphate aldolase [Chitinophagaceae bacterium]|nr:deoxyribose-phosphate aldolase [Chitinophagaceae bacterium]
MNIAAFIDHTVLKSTATVNDVDAVCREAELYGFAAVCIPPVYVQYAANKLKETNIKLATVIGFPFGYTYINAKQEEARQAISNGADELDMVISLIALKNGDYAYLENEVAAILEVVKKYNITLKIIIESGILTEQEILKCCKIYGAFDIDFLKTSTGYAEKGASIEAVQLMRHHLASHIQVKASGGIKTFDFAKQLIEAGATRLGCSASVAIVKEGESQELGVKS